MKTGTCFKCQPRVCGCGADAWRMIRGPPPEAPCTLRSSSYHGLAAATWRTTSLGCSDYAYATSMHTQIIYIYIYIYTIWLAQSLVKDLIRTSSAVFDSLGPCV